MARNPNCKSVFSVPSFQPQRQQHPPQPSATGAKATYLMAKVSNLSHCRLDMRCSCAGDYAVAPVQYHVSNALHAALHCGPAQHIQSHTIYHPYEPLHKCQHASWKLCMQQTHYIYTYSLIYACQFSNTHDSVECRCSTNCS